MSSFLSCSQEAIEMLSAQVSGGRGRAVNGQLMALSSSGIRQMRRRLLVALRGARRRYLPAKKS
jgi:hypothetical protein